MDGIKLQIDPEQLEPLIRKVVSETLASLGAGGVRPPDQPARKEAVGLRGTLLWKPRETAAALGICERTLWDLTSGNEIPHVRIGRAVRYAPDALRAWIDGRTNQSDNTSTACDLKNPQEGN